MHKDEHRRTDGGTDDGTDRRWDRQTVGRTDGGTNGRWDERTVGRGYGGVGRYHHQRWSSIPLFTSTAVITHNLQFYLA